MAMRVLYISKALGVSAYRAKLRALARRCELIGITPTRWRPAPEPLNGDEDVLRAEPIVFPGHHHLHLYRRTARILREARPDLVHIDEEPYSAVTYQFARACRRRRIPYLFFTWQNLAKRLPPPFTTLRARVFRWAAGGIAGTARAAAVTRDAGYAGPLEIVPQFGVDPGHFRPSAAARARRHAFASPETLVVGFAGRLVEEKGVWDLLEAVARIPRSRLIVIGDGPLRPALERARSELRERMVFRGWRPSWEMPECLAELDVLVLPSRATPAWEEQFGRVLIEAMACGVPVVGTATGAIPSVIGNAGIVVPAADAAGLAAALERLRVHPREREVLSARALARARMHFTHDCVAERSVAFYARLLATWGAA